MVHPAVRVGHTREVGVALRKRLLEMTQREGSKVKGGPESQVKSR